MTQQEFAERIIAMQAVLYRVSTTILRQLCDREDAVQECIRKAWQSREKLKDERAMQAWVIRILVNECYSVLRKRKRECLADVLPDREVEADANPNLYRLFTGLSEKYRLPMVLHYVEGYPIDDISRMLRLPQGTVKSRLHRGRLIMKDQLAAEEVRV